MGKSDDGEAGRQRNLACTEVAERLEADEVRAAQILIEAWTGAD